MKKMTSYKPSSRSDTEKTTEQYDELCEQLSKFIQNLCTYAKAIEMFQILR